MSNIGNRKNMRRSLTALVLASAVLALGAGATCSAATAGDAGSALSAPIEGTWIFDIYRVTQGFSFSALQSFTAGGVTLATGTVDRIPPPPISPLYGSWKRTGANGYVASISFFVFDPAGTAVAMIKTIESFQLVDNNNLTGSGTAFACNTNGDNCVEVNLPITIKGKRLVPGE
jgi:hypothetical protein